MRETKGSKFARVSLNIEECPPFALEGCIAIKLKKINFHYAF